MAGIDNTQLVQRFIQLPAEQRRLFLQKLASKGMSLAQLPIPVSRDQARSLPLSYAQQRQWFLWQLDRHSSVYHIPAALHLHGPLDRDALQRSLSALVERHESLRTTFEDAGETIQRVHPAAAVELQLHHADATDDAQARNALIERFVDSTVQAPFDLSRGPLLRARLLCLGAQEHVLVLALHHIVADGWSMQVLVRELVALYLGFSQGRPATLAALPIQYGDYAIWQRCWMEAGERERQLAYWTAHLGDEHPLLELPHDQARPALSSYRGGRCQINLPPGLLDALRLTCQREGITLFMLLLASFQLLLHRYSGQAQIRVGVPVANRNRAETEGLIGFFVNTQVLKADIDGQASLSSFLKQVKHTALQAQVYQDLPYEQLVDALQPERSLSFNPLFQVMFNHQVQGAKAQGSSALGEHLRIEALNWERHASPFDLNLDTFEEDGRLWASMTYALDLFEGSTIAAMGTHWQAVLQALTGDLNRRIDDLALQQVVPMTSAAAVYTPPELLLPMLQAQVLRQPHAVALEVDNQSYSYAELDARANRLAWQLVGAGVGPQVLVGLALQRSLDMVVAQLAVLKAGGAYVPLDPAYPLARLHYMINDSGLALLLTQAEVSARLGELPAPRTLHLDERVQPAPVQNPGAPQVDLHPDNLAYVIYTSGSTGQPKGVAIRHGGLANHMAWMRSAYGLTGDDRVLQKTAFSFDASVWEFWLPLLCGARLVLAPADLNQDLGRLWQLVAEKRITVLQLAPSLLQGLLPQLQPGQLATLRLLFAGGEALKGSLARQLAEQWPGQLVNLYGPTESTIDATSHALDADTGDAVIAIGQPISNVQAHVLNPGLQPCVQGGLGELYLGGASLAAGYYRRPGLTAERFVPDPFGAPGARLYRTGDLVRRRAHGQLHYVGRIDHQLKLRGLRIELGEIEACLLAQPGVREAVVLAQPGPRGEQLVGYVVGDAGQLPAQPIDQWREALQADLPGYMVPAQLLVLERLPLTVNGKLDRKALPVPGAAPAGSAFNAPQGALEQGLADIWQAVLNVERVGRQDNFFELGGDSIVSIQVVSRARQAGLHFSPKDLFQHQTVQRLAAVTRHGDESLPVDQGPVQGESALLPIQHGFFATPMQARHHWNQSVLLEARQTLDAVLLEQALQALVQHHDALRQRFVETAHGWRAEHRDGAGQTLLWQRSAGSPEALLALCEQAQRSLDLGAGPLLGALLVDLADGTQRLLLVVHHLVVDGVSWRILFEDLHTLYGQLAAGQTTQLPAKTGSVKSWAERLQAYAASGEIEAAARYWAGLGTTSASELPCDHPGGSLSKAHADSVRTRLDAELTRALLQQAPAAYRTQVNDLLLTALARVICQWSGQPSTWVELEGHGREALWADIDLTRTVGWFTSAFPACLSPARSLPASIKSIKEQLRAIPNKGLDHGVLRHLGTPAQQQALAQLPIPRITFNYLGQFDGSFDDPAALFAPAREPGGAEQGEDAPLGNWLSINGQVYQGELTLDWTFSRDLYAPATVQRLADALGRELAALVAHCLAAGEGGVTPSDFPLAGLDQAQLDRLPLSAAQIADLYPLSPMQQGMLFHARMAATTADYINQLRVPVEGLDAERLRAAWQATVDAHDSLRSQFHWQADFAAPLQLVLREVPVPFACADLRSVAGQPQAVEQLATQVREAGFALDRAPLLRLDLARTGKQQYQMIFTSHHILMDGWSNAQLLGEVLQRYAGETVAAPAGRYRDYIEWLQRRDGAANEAFWREQLQTFEGPTLLGQAIVGDADSPAAGDHCQRLSLAQTEALQRFARSHKVTLNTVVQGAWQLLLQRYSGQCTVTFGATVSGRPAELPGIEGQIGLFINSLPVIGGARPEQSLQAWLQALQALNLNLREHEHTPLYEIQRWAGRSGEALFDTLLVFENYPVAQALEQSAPAGLRFGEVAGHEQSGLPLTVLVDAGVQLAFTFKYRDFSGAVVQRLAGQLQQLLLHISTCSGDEPVGCLGLSTAEQRLSLLAQGQGATVAHPLQQSIQQLIEAQVERTPQAPALVFAGQTLSYRELNAQANALAHRLIAQGVGPDVLVGIAAERSLEMVIGLLAILKAGGAYVPLDPEYPAERLAYLFDDSGIELLLTQSWLLPRLPQQAGLRTVLLDAAQQDEWRIDNPGVSVQPEHLAYVIYTSGSTGKPKGAGNAHSALVNRVCWMQAAYGLDASDTVLQKTPFSFDVSVWEFFWPLMTGARLLMAAPGDHRDPARLVELIEQGGVSTLHFVPSMLQVFLQARDVGRCASLRRIICSGEALPADAQQQVFARLPQAGLFNLYGPTEAAIDVTHWTCVDDGRHSVPIGHAIDNLRTYILDTNLEPVVPGVLGELYLAGAGLARGYHRRPGLTAERFPADPFVPGQRMYRTGDLARYAAGGEIEYAGRLDHQVKIRGLRVELGEIESRLMEHPGVREAVVVARESAGDTQLIAYLVPEGEVGAEAQLELRQFLRQTLPEHMVPSHLLAVAQMPLSPNGKLDRRQLPDPASLIAPRTFRAPHSALQQQVAEAWQQVLKVEQVGLDDNFFQLGGHSLMATQVVMRLREQLAVEVPLKLLFESAGLEDFCAAVQGLQQELTPVQDELTKSLEALKRLSAEELENLLS
ncbi:non-ribosomal peptide synthetase [Pseudomonas alkylphenolica]|uniref:non-ribosomal peptide synthetase n=1 Tax=Pseudomonas alkylphenolica TaxID=237609 RepID=UPI0018DA17E2|nr:non-ribosomal peptide synthetase [Pseudomonas alkylphenolica]MBH3426467.1 amino acid adenylation domain-containing protein [Pseudomonas alkylphenolica]